MSLDAALSTRAGEKCELCESTDELGAYAVSPDSTEVERNVWICGTCKRQIEGEEPLDPRHWLGLQGAIWSEIPAVQAMSWRVASRLSGESWARDLLDQAYLDEEVLAWAKQGLPEPEDDDDAVVVVDSHGTPLADGDTVTVIKDLDVKGAGFVAKRGTVVKNIRLTDDPTHIEGRVNRVAIFLKTDFLKKVV